MNKPDFIEAMNKLRTAYAEVNKYDVPMIQPQNENEVTSAIEHYYACHDFFRGKNLSYEQSSELATFIRLKITKHHFDDKIKAIQEAVVNVILEQMQHQAEEHTIENLDILLGTPPPGVSSSWYIQILLDWRFQLFCSALLLAGTAGLTLSTFGIGTLTIAAITGLKAATTIGGVGLMSSLYCYFRTPAVSREPQENVDDLHLELNDGYQKSL